MVNDTTSDGNSSDTTFQGGMMERKQQNSKDDGSLTRLADWKITEMKHMRFKTTQKQQKCSKNMNKYPEVGKTGVDAVHGSCPQMV
jgi:hypothetical protein